MSDISFVSLLAPLILALMMFGMGLSLAWRDFTRLARQPKAVLLGSFLQMVTLPLIALGLVEVLAIRAELAVGMMVLAACPGGPGSNLLAYLCRGNSALSVTLTAISSILAVITIPFVSNLSLDWYLQQQHSISVVKTVSAVLMITLFPIIVGMAVAKSWPALAKRAQSWVKIGSIIFLLILVVTTFYKAKDQLATLIEQIGLAVVLLSIATVIVGFLVSALFKLNNADQKTIAIEVGIQNSALAIVISANILQSNVIAIPAAMYSPVMITVSLLFLLHHLASIRLSENRLTIT